jgi:hypothetical protein
MASMDDRKAALTVRDLLDDDERASRFRRGDLTLTPPQ